MKHLFLALLLLCPQAFAGDRSKILEAVDTIRAHSQFPQASNDRRMDNLIGATLFSGIATASLRENPYGELWAFGITVAGASMIEAHKSDSDMKNIWWAVGGAAIGTVGTCRLLLNKTFVGCAFSFK